MSTVTLRRATCTSTQKDVVTSVNMAAVMCVSEYPPKVVKLSVQDHACVNDESYKFYAERQEPPPGAPLMNGDAPTWLLGRIGVKYFSHDMCTDHDPYGKVRWRQVMPAANLSGLQVRSTDMRV